MSAARASAAVACALALACAGPGSEQRGRARVALRCPDGDAEVRVDGVPRGRADDFAGGTGRQLLLLPGVHRIEVQAKSGQKVSRELTVGPEDALTVAVELPPGSADRFRPLGAAKAYELVRGGTP